MQQQKLKIYFTSDVHGYFYPTTYGDMETKNVGLFGLAPDFHKDEDTLVIDGGDCLQGSAFAYYCSRIRKSPEMIARIYNDCGYDYYTLGNHDFNYGQEYQQAFIREADAVCLCENLRGEDGQVLYPWRIHQMENGLRIGIVGIITDYVNIWEQSSNLEHIRITDPFEAAKAALAQMKECTDLTLCIYHGGYERDLSDGSVLSETTENIACRICQELDFDILLTGHQHMSVAGQWVSGTYTLQPAENAKEYQYLEVTLENGHKEIHSRIVQCDAGKGAALREKYLPYEQKVQEWLNEPIGHLDRALMPEAKVMMALEGSPIADFLNSVQLYYSGAQISAVGLANEIAGFRKDVCTRDVIATYPYPNTLVVCKITGRQLKQVMERSAEYFAVQEDGSVTVSTDFLLPKVEHYNYDYYMGADYEIHPEYPIGQRIVNLQVNGKAVSDGDEYTMCLNNYRYSGTGGYEVYRECPLVKEINIEMVELIIDYLRSH